MHLENLVHRDMKP
jgi:serine/threonine protein kinase